MPVCLARLVHCSPLLLPESFFQEFWVRSFSLAVYFSNLIGQQFDRIGFVTNWLCCSARSRVIMWEAVGHICLPAILRAPERFLIEELGPVITCCLTKRAADEWVCSGKKA